MDKFNLNTFTLKLTLGTIWFVAIFLFICGLHNIFPLIEQLSATKTWGTLVSIPTLVFAYTLGEIATYLNNSSSFEEIDDFYIVAKSKNEFLIKRYENMQYQFQFFKTCVLTSIFLGVSVIWSSIRVLTGASLSGVKGVSIALGIITVA
ncbi:MAG: hypothetical protein AAFQ94_18950 [Bacteroidota bacterium]